MYEGAGDYHLEKRLLHFGIFRPLKKKAGTGLPDFCICLGGWGSMGWRGFSFCFSACGLKHIRICKNYILFLPSNPQAAIF